MGEGQIKTASAIQFRFPLLLAVIDPHLRHHFISKIILSGTLRKTYIHYLFMEILAPKFAHLIEFP